MEWTERIDYLFDLLGNWTEFVPKNQEMAIKRSRMMSFIGRRYEASVAAYFKILEEEKKNEQLLMKKREMELSLEKPLEAMWADVNKFCDLLKNKEKELLEYDNEVLIEEITTSPICVPDIEEIVHAKLEQETDLSENYKDLLEGYIRVGTDSKLSDGVLKSYLRKYGLLISEKYDQKKIWLFRNARSKLELAKEALISKMRYVLYCPGFQQIYIKLETLAGVDVTSQYIQITNFQVFDSYAACSLVFTRGYYGERGTELILKVSAGAGRFLNYRSNIRKILSSYGGVRERVNKDVDLLFFNEIDVNSNGALRVFFKKPEMFQYILQRKCGVLLHLLAPEERDGINEIIVLNNVSKHLNFLEERLMKLRVGIWGTICPIGTKRDYEVDIYVVKERFMDSVLDVDRMSNTYRFLGNDIVSFKTCFTVPLRDYKITDSVFLSFVTKRSSVVLKYFLYLDWSEG